MRYSVLNGLLLLAVSPLAALALPVDPNDQAGQWDPSGQYRKGHWQNGEFIPNNRDDRYNHNGHLDRNGQWRDNNRNGQNGWTDANGQWHAGNQDQNGWTDRNGQWHATGQSGGWTDANGQWHSNNGNVQARDGPNQNGWTDANGQWHANNQNDPNGWTDANGQWHSNNQNGQNGWTDANGQWHASNQNNQNGWTDNNGQWHANQKREVLPSQLNPTVTEKGSLKGTGVENKANPLNAVSLNSLHRRSWRDAGNDRDYDYNRNDDYNRNNDYNRDNDYNRNHDWNRDDCHRDDWNCRNRNNYYNRCRGDYRDSWECRVRGFLPTPTIIARNWPNDNNAQVTPSSQNNKYQSYGNYKNYGSYQNYPVNGQNQGQNKDTKATTGQQE